MIFLMIGILALALLFPYGWGLYHQMRLIKRLKRRGAQFGFELHLLHKFPWVPRNRSPKYDFYIEGEQRVYLIKLWASYHRGRSLLIGRDGRVAEQIKVVAPLRVKAKPTAQKTRRWGAWRPVPKTVCPALRNREKNVIPILLIYPTYDGIVRFTEDREVPLANGAYLFEKQLFTPSALERYIFEEEGAISL